MNDREWLKSVRDRLAEFDGYDGYLNSSYQELSRLLDMAERGLPRAPTLGNTLDILAREADQLTAARELVGRVEDGEDLLGRDRNAFEALAARVRREAPDQDALLKVANLAAYHLTGRISDLVHGSYQHRMAQQLIKLGLLYLDGDILRLSQISG